METSDNEIQIAKVLRRYERGVYNLLETGTEVLDSMTPENAPHVLGMLPDAVREYVVGVANDAPTTDAEWESAQYFSIGAGSFSPGYVAPTEEERQAAMEKWKVTHRACVEAIRASIA